MMYSKTMLKNKYFPKGSIIILLIFIIINLLSYKIDLQKFYKNDFNYSMATEGAEKGVNYYIPRIVGKIFLCKDLTQFVIILIFLGSSLIWVDISLIKNSLLLGTIFLSLGIAGTMAYLGVPIKDYGVGVVPVMLTTAFLGMVLFIKMGVFGLLKVLLAIIFIAGFLALSGWNMDIGENYIFIWRFLALGVLIGIVLYGRKKFLKFFLTDTIYQ